MRKQFVKLALMAMCVSVPVMTACSDDDDNQGNTAPVVDNSGNTSRVLGGDVTSDLTLEAGQTYTLTGKLQVKAPAVLTIPEGVTIVAKYDGNCQYILIEQGAKIVARGTAEKPVVMTSESKKEGAWGGLHICGRAHTNNGSGMSEIGNAPYGGRDDNDNSGELSYVRLEYTGYAFDSEHESNGVSFYGVGRGTKVSYVQAYMGADDGFEFFGGSVNIDHCVVVNCSDDSYDWTEGWNGTASYLVAYQEDAATLGFDCDCLIEADNNGSNYNATPVAHPVLSNLTLVGNGGAKQGIRLRAGTEAEIYNAQVTGKGLPLTVETTQTETALKNGVSKLSNIAISGELNSKEGIYTNDDFVAAGNKVDQHIALTDRFVGMTEGRGAVEASNLWMAGWTK